MWWLHSVDASSFLLRLIRLLLLQSLLLDAIFLVPGLHLQVGLAVVDVERPTIIMNACLIILIRILDLFSANSLAVLLFGRLLPSHLSRYILVSAFRTIKLLWILFIIECEVSAQVALTFALVDVMA